MTLPALHTELAETLAAITDPIHANGCNCRHQQGETDECNSCTAHTVETEVAAALQPLIVRRIREARRQALMEAASQLDTLRGGPTLHGQWLRELAEVLHGEGAGQ